MEFVREARLVIHNAAFDVGFLNAELGRCGHPVLEADRAACTLSLARRKHPGASNSLDALCSRYGIDNSRRTKHGALLDAEILAEVYIELIGGKQADLGLAIGRAAAPRGNGANRRAAPPQTGAASRLRMPSAPPISLSSRRSEPMRSGAITSRTADQVVG